MKRCAMSRCLPRRKRAILPALVALAFLTGCASSGTDTAAPTPAPITTAAARDAETIANGIADAIPEAVQVIVYTETSDPNSLLGRPNGYTSAAAINDTRLEDVEPGVDLGAVVEVWPTEAEARARSDYIQQALKDAPALGTEYHHLDGPTLLRVSGHLPPTASRAYGAAFTPR